MVLSLNTLSMVIKEASLDVQCGNFDGGVCTLKCSQVELVKGVLNTPWPKIEQHLFLTKLHMAQNGYENLNCKL